MDSETILSVNGLCVAFRQGRGTVRAVDDACFDIRRGEMMALVGESGSGKSVTALSLMGLLPSATSVIEGGTAIFDGIDLLTASDSRLCELRGRRISMVFQEPMTALNPVLTIGWQLREVLRRHENLTTEEAQRRAVELLDKVGVADAARRISEYPHNMSGGMRQRVMIAMALACRPELLIADEPTTALDVTVQAQIMDLLAELRKEYGTAVLLITHNLALVREQADRVAVMYAGNIVEQTERETLFANPSHPYTRLLMQAIPSMEKRGTSLASIAGQVPPPSQKLPGCRFAPRCPYASPECENGKPALKDIGGGHLVACVRSISQWNEPANASSQSAVDRDDVLLKVSGLTVRFPIKGGLFSRRKECVHAVEGVSLELRRGETLALVGESGCGKTTVGKALMRLVEPSGGSIVLDGTDLAALKSSALKPYRKRMQMIFQDPFASLDPRQMVGETIAEGMDAHGLHRNDRQAVLEGLLEKVGLPSDSLTRYPHQFSGGQRQRIGLARALAVEPEIIVCDECTSALDVSVSAQILNLLKTLQMSMHLSYLFITHDLSVVGYIADRVAVMYLGRIVEQGTADEVLLSPAHPYTRALIASAPSIERDGVGLRKHIEGEVPSPVAPPSGCPFHPRCPMARPECGRNMPQYTQLSDTHIVACVIANEG
ncbi:MAG: ABC transporter ATP-binding protein [Victivallales bacterium]|nr:ABC transporter ATP-binding protein [Victivallales bacterium]